MATLKRQLLAQQKQMQHFQQALLQNQAMLMAQQQLRADGAAPSQLMPPALMPASALAARAAGTQQHARPRGGAPKGANGQRMRWDNEIGQWAESPPALPPPAERGDMSFTDRQALKGRLEQLTAAKLQKALEGLDLTSGELDLATLDSARLWRLHDACAAAPRPKQQRRPRAPGPGKCHVPSKSELLDRAAAATDHKLAEVRAARAAVDAGAAADGFETSSAAWTEDDWTATASDAAGGGDTADDGDALLGELDADDWADWTGF